MVYGWTSPEGKGPLWRKGRAHLVAREAGRKSHGGQSYHDIQLNAEWSIIPKYKFGFGFEVKVGNPGSENDLHLHLFFGPLANLFLSGGGFMPRRLLVPGYDSRVTGFRIAKDHGKLEVWMPRNGGHRRGTPWWRYSYVNWERFFCGQVKSSQEIIDDGTTIIPMPEANYSAGYETRKYTNVWPTRFGRFRSPAVHYMTVVEPTTPVPIPGKGENSWDCDDDALHSVSVAGCSVEAAVAKVVETALSTRKKYGGQQMSVAAGTRPRRIPTP